MLFRGEVMRLKSVMAAVAMGLCSLAGSAQMSMGGSAAPAGKMVEPSKALDDLLMTLEHDVMGVVKTMPADKYNFAPSHATFAAGQGEKFDGVRTFAEQVSHLAQANYFFAMGVSGQKPDRDVAAIAKLTTKDELVKALADSFAFAHKANATVTVGNAFLTIKGEDGLNTRVTLAAFIATHGYDHYGQMVEYLRMNGHVPPSSAPEPPKK